MSVVKHNKHIINHYLHKIKSHKNFIEECDIIVEEYDDRVVAKIIDKIDTDDSELLDLIGDSNSEIILYDGNDIKSLKESLSNVIIELENEENRSDEGIDDK